MIFGICGFLNLNRKKRSRFPCFTSGLERESKILDTLLDRQYQENLFEGIVYADVKPGEEEVEVYARGECFSSYIQGTSFAYQGTVSQAISDKKLEFLVVDDTLESTRPIDWALFIPHGIRSYFAKPFYERNTIRSVLILCSLRGCHFSALKLDEYAVYYDPFLRGMKNWRKELRERKRGRSR